MTGEVYRVDVAPAGQVCEGAVHGPVLAPAAVVATADGSFWCALCWWPIAVALLTDGHRVVYSATARDVLGIGV
ncbi:MULTISPECIES: hypothetical protein [Thermomonospora]|uniref:Uncharacterized protein n=1 Tax=Thermomonospora curvata (strain ATCC 19995 / DSM 43183 / JCM 3096 / KCTC 9072 / NBRC 15933 / NCIMB 10081 / Henssen B9) TaxID=471852 RepID=D1A2C2_THECD|nr:MULTISPECIES: hypothetical protein [Thermomonospora]ACY95942.1 hypothetical protein Tcur_0340 [Thermomonospora curvata DSM 43183]PKK16185.1 MAG: hypothetical protein BUE48_001685 [Thermomonospora sp. CIF 1]